MVPAAREMVARPSSRGLPEHSRQVTPELGQFVQQEHAKVGQRDLA